MNGLRFEAEGMQDRKLRIGPFRVEKELVISIAVVIDPEGCNRECRVEHRGRFVQLHKEIILEDCCLFLKRMQNWQDVIQVIL